MPRGKYVSHKGKHRRFNNPEEIQEQMQKMQKEQEWREQHGDDSSGGEEAAGGKAEKEERSDNSEESSSEDEAGKKKGVQHLIQVENPNRAQKKVKKVTELNIDSPSTAPQLSRREREELEKQRAAANYQRLHAMGKTDEARADLARLAIIKQQREDAARRREAEKTEKEAQLKTKAEQTSKAMGRKKT